MGSDREEQNVMSWRKLVIRKGTAGLSALLIFAAAAVAAALFSRGGPQACVSAQPFDTRGGAPSAQRGRYIVRVGGCNDCHTPGFMERGEAVPESVWLTGTSIGWKGPWGTTYPSNLRLFVTDFEEDTFVEVIRARRSRPPMPWPNLHAMSDQDLRSVFRYIRSLPITGEKMPAYVPAGEQPKTPYFEFEPKMPQIGG
jgi:mono/diheme cytochrome c family protein